MAGFDRESPRARGNLIREPRLPVNERLGGLDINAKTSPLAHRNLPVAVACNYGN
jgi:hypothetical protein